MNTRSLMQGEARTLCCLRVSRGFSITWSHICLCEVGGGGGGVMGFGRGRVGRGGVTADYQVLPLAACIPCNAVL